MAFRSARRYMERRGLVRAYLGPGPRLAPCRVAVHQVPQYPPFPTNEARVAAGIEGNPVPDRGLTEPWPWRYST